MLRLDCSSPSTTCSSLSQIFTVEAAEVERRCRALDLEPFFDDPDRPLIEALFGSSLPVAGFDVVYFHLTRAFPSRLAFTEGLLPLGDALEQIWSDLYELARDACPPADWAQFRAWVEMDHPINVAGTRGDLHHSQAAHLIQLYRMKVATTDLWGPFGFLIREVALTAPSPVRSYLTRPPEIVEDICTAYEDWRGGSSIADAYLLATQPCVVKFRCANPSPADLRVAAEYLCAALQGRELHSRLALCFDGGGQQVPPAMIMEVQVNPAL